MTNHTEAFSSLLQRNDLAEFGFAPGPQAKRAHALREVLGDEGLSIALLEKKQNEKAYLKEFILDHALSDPRIYYSYNQELYSFPKENPILKIKDQIHEGERNGDTLSGFKKYEKRIHDNTDNDVHIWYSPSGKAGDKPPFDRINFESGRFYVCFRGENNTTTHFDFKVQEGDGVSFPVLDVLNSLSGRQEASTFDYLKEPFSITNAQEFFSHMNAISHELKMKGQDTVYVSQRNSADSKTTHTLESVMEEMALQLPQAGLAHKKEMESLQGMKSFQLRAATSEQEVRNAYLQMMLDHMEKTGRTTLELYGCSATNVHVTKHDLLSHRNEIMKFMSFDGFASLYSTFYRMFPNTFGMEDKRGFTCPKCNVGYIPYGSGMDTCPHCKITKQEYAAEKNQKPC